VDIFGAKVENYGDIHLFAVEKRRTVEIVSFAPAGGGIALMHAPHAS